SAWSRAGDELVGAATLDDRLLRPGARADSAGPPRPRPPQAVAGAAFRQLPRSPRPVRPHPTRNLRRRATGDPHRTRTGGGVIARAPDLPAAIELAPCPPPSPRGRGSYGRE